MRIERTKNATRNMIYGILLKIYQLAVPFLMRIAMIYFMGVQYLGLNSLFTSVLQVLNLAELGIGSAMVYSMYKPIAKNESVTICALLKLYKIYYRVIGFVILGIGLFITPFIPNLISGDVPENINIYILYLLNLSATVLTYWLFAYKNSLFQAHQRVDVVSKVTIITDTLKYVFQFAVIIFVKNYYYYVIAILVTQIINNISVAVWASKEYPQYKPEGSLDKSEIKVINRRIRDLFTSKVGSVIVDSADTIVISAFLGLTVLAVYQNYFYIFTAVAGLIQICFTSVTAGIGNSIIVDSKEKVYADFETFMMIITWIAGFCCSCFLCLYQPFMELWVGRELMLEFNIVICFVVYFFVYELNKLLNLYKDASGMWHEDRFRPLVTALTNLVLNLIMVQFIGLYGIILSTVISTVCVGMPWLIHNLFSVVFDHLHITAFLKKMAYYIPVTILMCAVSYALCSSVHTGLFLTVVIRLFICCIVSNLLLLLFYHRLPEFRKGLRLIDKMLKYKIKPLHKIVVKTNE
ncbi:MAG: polysaccharide biosynthesis protein [Bacteroides thetaiotaomicron]|nr:polysaccharide biosynthesis protein [Bacteroides thetaiotaomicron]